jgi:hypothetical protein
MAVNAASVLAVSLAAAAWHAVQSGAFSWAVFAAGLVVFASSVSFGVLFCRAARMGNGTGIDVIHAVAAGILIYKAMLLFLALTSPVAFKYNVILLFTVSTGACIFLALKKGSPHIYISPCGALTLAAAFIAAGFWSCEYLVPIRFDADQVIVHPWQDIFFHTRQTAFLGNLQGVGSLSDFNVRGMPVPFYHYASYMVPAAIHSLVSSDRGITAFSLTAAVIPPLGIFLTGVAAYSFGKMTARSDVAGLFAAAGLLAVPDPSFYGLGNRWTGYYFFQQVGMAGPFAVAALVIAWTFALRSVREGSIAAPFFCLAFCGITALCKIQIAAVHAIFPILAMTGLHPKLSRRARVHLSAFAAVAYIMTLHLAGDIRRFPTMELSTSGAMPNIKFILENFTGWPAVFWSKIVGTAPGYLRQVLAGIPLVLISIYGLWLLLFPAACLLLRNGQDFHRVFKVFPLLAIIPHLVIALGMAPNQGGLGDPFEIIHKTFVWPYFAVVVWACTVIGWKISRVPWAGRNIGVIGTAAVLAALSTFFWGRTVQSGIFFSGDSMNSRLPLGLYETARQIRNNSQAGDVVQLSENDPNMSFAAFTERPFHALHSGVNAGPMDPETARRFGFYRELMKAGDYRAFGEGMRAEGIAWFVVKGPAPVGWEGKAVMKDARGGEFTLYKTEGSIRP